MRRLLLAVSILALAATAHARPGPGSTAANFLKLGVGPRAVAMGEAFTGLADDANSVFYNPAGLGTVKRQEVQLMHNDYYEGITQEWGAYAYPTAHFGTIGAGFNLLKIKPFDAFDELDQRTGQIDASDMAALLSYARGVGEGHRLSIGMTGKYIKSRLAGFSASAVAFDAGALYLYGHEGSFETRYRFGASIRNLGNDLKFIEEGFPLPQSLHLGASRDAPMPHPMEDMRLILLVETVIPRDGLPYPSAGVEFRIVRELALRAGYRGNQETGLGVSAGIGFTSLNKGFTKAWFPEISLDYTFVDYGKLDQAHRVGFTVRFGYNVDAKIEYESLFEPTQ